MDILEILGRFVLAALAVWRVTLLVATERGPFAIMQAIRDTKVAKSYAADIECFSCMSLWVSAMLSIFVSNDLWSLLVVIPALSGLAIALEMILSRSIVSRELSNSASLEDELLQSDQSSRRS